MNASIQPIRRNLKFVLPEEQVLTWNPEGLHVTQFFNTLSIFFPAGERFFIQSVRNFRARLTDATLNEQISAFIGQEGFHTREHEAYNAALKKAGMPIDTLDKIVVELLQAVQKTPDAFQLAATVALEHLTAVLGDMLLSNDFLLRDAEAHYAAIWNWHALEETEHKAVCFDAYTQVVGDGVAAYSLRVTAFVIANALFWSLFLPFYVAMLRRSGGLFQLKGWRRLGQLLVGRPGVMRRVFPDWLDFFRPGFHPWMHDNQGFLQQAEALVAQVSGFQPGADVAIAIPRKRKTR